MSAAERVRESKRPHLSPANAARLIVVAGSALISVGLGLVFAPAGIVAAGIALILIGLLLVPAEV